MQPNGDPKFNASAGAARRNVRCSEPSLSLNRTVVIITILLNREECSRGDSEADEPWIMTVRGGAGARASQLPVSLHAHMAEDKRRTLHDDAGNYNILAT